MSDWVVNHEGQSSEVYVSSGSHNQMLIRWGYRPRKVEKGGFDVQFPNNTQDASKQYNFATIRWVPAFVSRNGMPFCHYAANDSAFRDEEPVDNSRKIHYENNMAHVDSIHVFCVRVPSQLTFEAVPYDTPVLVVVARHSDIRMIRHTNNVGNFTHEEAVVHGHVFTPNGRLHGTHDLSIGAMLVNLRCTTPSDNIMLIVAASNVMYLKGVYGEDNDHGLQTIVDDSQASSHAGQCTLSKDFTPQKIEASDSDKQHCRKGKLKNNIAIVVQNCNCKTLLMLVWQQERPMI